MRTCKKSAVIRGVFFIKDEAYAFEKLKNNGYMIAIYRGEIEISDSEFNKLFGGESK